MKIENLQTNGLFLAPMAGVTDFAFRSLAREFGADFSYTEMISAKALCYENKKTLELLHTLPEETPVGIQIFGHEPEAFVKALKMQEISKFDLIDINMGCPAPKIVKNGDGSALMKDFKTAENVLKTCVKYAQRPVTVKMRLGFDKDVSLDFAKMLSDNGASAICVHGRLREDFYSGTANLDAIAKVVASVPTRIIGNGDVFDEASYKNMLATGVNGVMIGRGALGKPQIFSEIKGEKVKFNKFEIIEKHISLLRQFYSEEFLSAYMKKHLLWYLKEEKGASGVKIAICKETDLNKCLQLMKDFLQK